ncbi:MAG: hypothetical protein ACK2TV_05695 [Anaerolineales bacterium]
MKKRILFVLMLLIGILLSACKSVASQGEDKYVYGQEATVESLDVAVLESDPTQAVVTVSGYLPDGCTELDEIDVERAGKDFNLTLNTRRLTEVACTESLVPFEQNVYLNISDLSGGFTVIAQNQTATFSVESGSAYPVEEENMQYTYGSDATLESISVNIMESFPVQISVSLQGYLPDGCTELNRITSSRDGQVFTIVVETKRPTGEVACTMAIVPFERTVNLDVRGLSAGDYTVNAGELSETFTLDMDNTYP